MKKMYLEPEMELVDMVLGAPLLNGSGIMDVTDEDYEHIGEGGESGAIAE